MPRSPATRPAARPASPVNPGARVDRPSTPDLPLPHERDAEAGYVDPAVDPQAARAGRDLAEGQVDTDLRATPGLDAPRRRELLRREAASAPSPAAPKRARGAR